MSSTKPGTSGRHTTSPLALNLCLCITAAYDSELFTSVKRVAQKDGSVVKLCFRHPS